MSITNGYCTLAELKAWLDITDTNDDGELEAVIEAASRWIDDMTGRRFYSATEARYYTADNPNWLYIDDIARGTDGPLIITLKTDSDGDGTYETTWSASDYVTKPRNPVLVGTTYQIPVTSLEVNKRTGDYSFPVSVQDGVQVSAPFGYSGQAPPPVKTACLMASARFWKRKDSIFGLAGVAQLGVQAVQVKISADPDILSLLKPFRKVIYG